MVSSSWQCQPVTEDVWRVKQMLWIFASVPLNEKHFSGTFVVTGDGHNCLSLLKNAVKEMLLRIVSQSLALWNALINFTLARGWISFHCGHILPSRISIILKATLKKALFPIDQLESSLCLSVMSAEWTAHKWDILVLIALARLPFLPIDFQSFGITLCAVSEPPHTPVQWHRLNCTVYLCLDEHLCNLWISRDMSTSSPVQNTL